MPAETRAAAVKLEERSNEQPLDASLRDYLVTNADIVTRITREVDSDGKALVPPEVIETKGLALNDAVKKILGKAGTKVKLTVQREGIDHPVDVEITRGRVEVDTVLGWKRNSDDDWNYVIDRSTRSAMSA